MNEYVTSALILITGVLIASFSQILLKIAAKRSYSSVIKQYLNLRVIVGYGMLLLSTLFSLAALRLLPLSFTPVADAAGQVFILILSFLILKERPGKKKLVGIALIVAGILIISI